MIRWFEIGVAPIGTEGVALGLGNAFFDGMIGTEGLGLGFGGGIDVVLGALLATHVFTVVSRAGMIGTMVFCIGRVFGAIVFPIRSRLEDAAVAEAIGSAFETSPPCVSIGNVSPHGISHVSSIGTLCEDCSGELCIAFAATDATRRRLRSACFHVCLSCWCWCLGKF